VTDFIEQRRGVSQGCSLSPYFFIIFIDDIIDYISKANPDATITGTNTIPQLLFVDDLTLSTFTINGLQKATGQVTKYCREWNLKWNPSKTEILVFKEGIEQKKDDRWTVNDQNLKWRMK
jgi:hypothetical protein